MSDDELAVLREIVAGNSWTHIAIRFALQPADLETRKASLMRKLGAASTADLVRVGVYAEL